MTTREAVDTVRVTFAEGAHGQTVWIHDPRLGTNRAVCIISTKGGDQPQMIEGRFTKVRAPLPSGSTLWVNVDYFEVFPEPRQSGSSSSGALYVAQSRDPDLGWLMQVLPPWSETSRHHHDSRREFLANLCGHCQVELGDQAQAGDLTRRHVDLRPRIIHRFRTNQVGAINLLVISGHPEPLTWADHHYCESTGSQTPAS